MQNSNDRHVKGTQTPTVFGDSEGEELKTRMLYVLNEASKLSMKSEKTLLYWFNNIQFNTCNWYIE